MPIPLRDVITEEYYKTTSSRSHTDLKLHYQNSVKGLLRWLGPWLPSGKENCCLDLGCGLGEMIYLLECKGYKNTVGVNLCKEEIELAKDFIKGKLVYDDVLNYLKGCQSESIDFITALNFLEHLTKNDLLSVLNEAKRVLKPGGTLVAIVPNAISPFSGLTRHWDITHEWAFTPNNFRQLAALTGFDSEIDFRECGPRVHGFFSAARYLLWQVLRFFVATWFLVEVANTRGGIYTMDMLVRLRVKSDNV